MTARRALTAAFVALLLLPAASPSADARRPQAAQEQDGRISAGDAASIVASRTGGQVLGVRSEGDVYLVRVLVSKGKVREVAVDARTGRMR